MKLTSKTIEYSVPTVDDLPTTEVEENQTIVVTDEDRGGVFIARDSGEPNDGTIFNGGSLNWHRQYDRAVNVRWFGAVGDGVADDTASINLALSSLGEKTLLFPEGVYITNGYHNIVGKRIEGENTKAIIKLSGSNTYDVLMKNNPNNLSEAGTWGSGGSDIHLKNISLQGNWDGSTGQTTITPVSGNGNGITGILKADYSIDNNKAVLQLISSTRVFMDNVSISFGYGHNMIFYRGGYSYIKKCSFTTTRGSGIYSPNPSTSDTVTSCPIESCDFETCSGEYGGIYAQYWSGTSVTNTIFEAQPYGIYAEECIDFVTTGNYGEAHYYEDFYTSPTSWGVVDIGNYAFGQTKPVSPYKGFFHYRRDSGLFVDTDNTTYGTRPAEINSFFIQRGYTAHGGLQTIVNGLSEKGNYFSQMLASVSGSSLAHYSIIRHQHYANSLSGAAEIRFKRNLHSNGWSGMALVTGNGTTLTEALQIDAAQHVTLTANVSMINLPTTDPAVAGQLWNDTANGNVVKVSTGA